MISSAFSIGTEQTNPASSHSQDFSFESRSPFRQTAWPVHGPTLSDLVTFKHQKLSLHLLPPPSHSLHAINGFTFDYFLLKRIHPFCLKKNGCWCCICTADFSLVSCNPAIFATNYWSCKQGLIWLSSSRYLESPFLKNWSRMNNFRSIIGTNNATFTFNWKIASLGT